MPNATTTPHPTTHAMTSPYGYVPTEWITITFLSLYAISTIAHITQAFFFRIWWLFPTAVIAGTIEVLGWSGRVWSSISPTSFHPFQIQITGTILAPTPLAAGNFIILGHIVRQLGPVYSRLSPKWYTILFCGFDLVSLVIQAIGGGLASAAFGQHKNPATGGNIMLGGIVCQMVAIILYVLCAVEFFLRYLHDRPLQWKLAKSPKQMTEGTEEDSLPRYFRGELTTKMKIMLSGLGFSTLCLFIRAIYRTIELSDGWTGRIITTQIYFNVLDGAMVTLAIYTMNFIHPGLFLGLKSSKRKDDEKGSSNSSQHDNKEHQ